MEIWMTYKSWIRTLMKSMMSSKTSIRYVPFRMQMRPFTTADQIKQLRSATGSPIGECRKALEQSKGDFEKAKQLLRDQGMAYADKRAERATKQGQICLRVSEDAKTAVMIELNCETDFVAKTDVFKQGIREYFETLSKTDDIDVNFGDMKNDAVKQRFMSKSLTKSLDPDMNQMTVGEGLTFIISKTRENWNIGSIFRQKLDGNKMFGGYLHNKSEDWMGKHGALVIMNANSSVDISKIAASLAMHVTAMRPTYISKAKVPKEIEKVDDKDILESQEFINEHNVEALTVKQFISRKGKELGTRITIEDFVLFTCS